MRKTPLDFWQYKIFNSHPHETSTTRLYTEPQFVMRPGDPQHERAMQTAYKAMQTVYNKYLRGSEELDVAGSEMTSPTTLAMLVAENRNDATGISIEVEGITLTHKQDPQ